VARSLGATSLLGLIVACALACDRRHHVAGALAVMAADTGLIAVDAELASAALEATSTQLGLSRVFMGVVVLALAGTAADLFAAVAFAHQDKMDIVFQHVRRLGDPDCPCGGAGAGAGLVVHRSNR
jgi:hypothetical protein